jgi:hypothetical protein
LVWDEILATCGKKIVREEYGIIIKIFNHYLSIIEEQGHSPLSSILMTVDLGWIRMFMEKFLLELQQLHKKVISCQNVLATNIKRTYAVNVSSQSR